MAPHSLSLGDVVTHPDWPAGETRTVIGFAPFRRIGWAGKRRKLIDDPNVRIVFVDSPIDGGSSSDGPEDAWMEAGLALAETAP